jgi:ferritin-like metal-binding protein YciE
MIDKTLHDAFIDELRDAFDAEKQIIKALPKMVRKARSPQLCAAFANHLEETKGQVRRLQDAFGVIGEKVRGKHCDGMAGILKEGASVMEEEFDDATMDACLIAAAQRVEHYEMAAYGTLIAWAKTLGEKRVVKLLEQTLKQENSADKKLTGLAEDGINQAAASAGADAE